MDEIKLVCFDLNKTLIHENSWFDLHMAMGVSKEEDIKMYEDYYQGKITYLEWISAIFNYYKSRGTPTREKIASAVFNYNYMPGAREIVAYLKEKGYKVALISGAMDLLVRRVAEELGISEWAANNTFVFDINGTLSRIDTIDDDKRAKVIMLEEICAASGISMSECAAVGDGDNEHQLFEKTGHGITFRGSSLEAGAWKVIDKLEDLKNIF